MTSKVPGDHVHAWGQGQVWQLVLRSGSNSVTATSVAAGSYISHVDTISKQNNIPCHPKHTRTHVPARR